MIKKEYKKDVKKFNPFKNREILELSFSVFQLFRRMFAIVSYSEEKKLLPDKIDFTVVIMLNQFAEDVNPLLKMSEQLLNSENEENSMEQQRKKKEISLVRDKFNSFLNNVEEYMFSSF